MNKKPFLEVGIGEIFHTVRHPTIPLMKTGNQAAVLLESYLDEGAEQERGSIRHFPSDTKILEAERQQFTLPRTPAEPEEAPRMLWKHGETVKVGIGLTRRLPVFAGLYIHAGKRDILGAYYSKDRGQVMFLEEADARIQSHIDGVDLVVVDAFYPPEYLLEDENVTA